MNCPHCQSSSTTERQGRTVHGFRRFRCRGCGRRFNERTGTALNRVQVPTDIMFLVVFWRLRYKLSLRDLAEMFLIRGIVFSHEAVRDWEAKRAPLLAGELRRRRHGKGGARGRHWHVDETYLKVRGRWCYLYRAIDRDGRLVDTMLSERRDMAAARPHRDPPRQSPPPASSPPCHRRARNPRGRVSPTRLSPYAVMFGTSAD